MPARNRFGSLPQRVAARLAGLRDRVEPPDLLAGGGVVRADEAFLFAIGLAGAEALDHLALGDERAAAGRVIALRAVADDGLPDGLAGSGIERDEMRVARGGENLVVVDRDAAHGGGGRGWCRTGFPRSRRRSCRRAPG